MNNPLRSSLHALGTILLHPIRLIAIVVLGCVLVVVGLAYRQWHGELQSVAGPAIALGRAAKAVQGAQLPTRGAPAEVPQSRVKGKRSLRHPFGGPPQTLAENDRPTDAAPVKVRVATPDQEAQIHKDTGLPAPAAGEHRIWGPGAIPCKLDPLDHATFECRDTTGHLRVRGNAEVLLSDTTGKARLVFTEERPGFLELSHFSEGWRIGGGPTYTYSTTAAGLGAEIHVAKDTVRTGRITWQGSVQVFAEPAPAGALGAVYGRVLGARGAVTPEWRSGVP